MSVEVSLNRIGRKIRKMRSTVNESELISALISLNPLIDTYVPWTSSAMHPAAVRRVVNEILINDRRHVIEFGSGVSTVYAAAALKELGGLGGDVVSVEHDRVWINVVEGMLKRAGLIEFVKFIEAPLQKSQYSVGDLAWYSHRPILEEIGAQKRQLVLIDGPLAYTKDLEMSRFPALPFLVENELLDTNHAVMLDDSVRLGERKVIDLWSRRYRYHFFQLGASGAAIAVIGEAFNAN